MRLGRILIYVLIGFILAQGVFFYPNLPQLLASNFDGAGNPNGWMSKEAFLSLEAGLLTFILGAFALVPFVMARAPHSVINLPRRDFWLASERKAETVLTIRKYFEWFSVLLIALFIAVNHIVFLTNISKEIFPTRIFLVILVVFLVLTILGTVKFIRHFSSKPL